MLKHYFFSTRILSTEDLAASYQEAVLCVTSCFRVLKAVSDFSEVSLLLDCLRSIETWIAVLDKTAILEHDSTQTFEKMEQVVVDSFDIVKKWLEKSLLGPIPCYNTADANKELEVGVSLYIYLLNSP